jgi:LuxR family transcriptional regulator, maltose regulon positive regulatory protein
MRGKPEMVIESVKRGDLLESKLFIPNQTHKLVTRPHLLNTLENQVTQHKLTLISAPAGYGKTTLLADWARSSNWPLAWLTITGEENDIDKLLRYLLAAWETMQPDIVEQPLGILLSSQMPEMKAVLSAFIQAANALSGHIVFILDDYHLIEEAAVHDTVAFLLDHLPTRLHVILAGRNDPPLPLARYRARGQLLEIRADDLHFTYEETASFLNQSMQLDLTIEQIDSLHARSEGWIAGLQLAALAFRRYPDSERIPRVSGRQRFIADYLAKDVLNQIQSDLREFLLRTSLLSNLCGPLCDAVTGQKKGQAMLEAVERENLFITPLDDRREWYRYHHLFAEFLQGELARHFPDEVTGLHRRAARWYLSHNLMEEAFRHGLAGEDADLVIEIFDRNLGAKLAGGEIKIVANWIESIPENWFFEHPEIDLARTGLLIVTGALEAAVRNIDEIEERLSFAQSADRHAGIARATAVRCFIACFQNNLERAQAYAEQALNELPQSDISFRLGVYGALGDTYRRNGFWEEANQNYLKALDFTHAPETRVQAMHVFGALADLELRQGHLKRASAYWRKALVFIQERESWGRLPLPVIGWVYIRMAEIFYEWNQLSDAWNHVSRGLKRAELGGDVRSLIAGYVIAARLKLAEGEVEGAAEYLERARPLEEQASFPDWTSQFERTQLELWLAQDRLRTAVLWSDEMSHSSILEDRPESVISQLTMTRVLIVKGDSQSLEAAYSFLERLLDLAERQGLIGVLIEALALQALADWKRSRSGSALVSLERALRLAEPQGYLRLFINLGLPMAHMLQKARSRRVFPEYIDKLLSNFNLHIASTAQNEPPLTEPLTRREQEILQLMSAGLTNQEIAEELVISAETVKKHTGNIYSKLRASNRTEAAARARDLDLLS